LPKSLRSFGLFWNSQRGGWRAKINMAGIAGDDCLFERKAAMTDKDHAAIRDLIPESVVDQYRERGFARVPGILSKDEAAEFHAAALDASKRLASLQADAVFSQFVNVWRQDGAMRRLTLHPRVAAAGRRLAGAPLRLWHDQILIKQPHNQAPTEFHQDQPYWPHANSPNPISAWIALCDVPVERGCMSFIPGSHKMTDLTRQNLRDPKSLFSICPDLAWKERATIPLRAGDCTFHHGRCAHMAGPNETDEPRVAHVVIFIDAATVYRDQRHPVTVPLDLKDGQPLDADLFPAIEQFPGLVQMTTEL
jgi:phytanoyl-CoA hydroxylase